MIVRRTNYTESLVELVFIVLRFPLKLKYFLAPFQDEPYSIKLLGRAWQNIVFLRGWDELMPGAESLRAEVEEEEEEGLGPKLLSIVYLKRFVTSNVFML